MNMKDNRDMLLALLRDMHPELPATEIDLSELGPQDRLFMLVACCTDMIAVAIRTAAHDRAEALLGLEAMIDDIRSKIKRGLDAPETKH